MYKMRLRKKLQIFTQFATNVFCDVQSTLLGETVNGWCCCGYQSTRVGSYWRLKLHIAYTSILPLKPINAFCFLMVLLLNLTLFLRTFIDLFEGFL